MHFLDIIEQITVSILGIKLILFVNQGDGRTWVSANELMQELLHPNQENIDYMFTL